MLRVSRIQGEKYGCLTCQPRNPGHFFLCEQCAKSCHKGHNIVLKPTNAPMCCNCTLHGENCCKGKRDSTQTKTGSCCLTVQSKPETVQTKQETAQTKQETVQTKQETAQSKEETAQTKPTLIKPTHDQKNHSPVTKRSHKKHHRHQKSRRNAPPRIIIQPIIIPITDMYSMSYQQYPGFLPYYPPYEANSKSSSSSTSSSSSSSTSSSSSSSD